MTRIEREKLVVGLMIGIYCRKKHGSSGGVLCPDCAALADYTSRRLDHCPKGNGKSNCQQCAIHCYSPSNQAKIREVMRYVGPRMIFIHPWYAFRHLLMKFTSY